MYDGPIIDPHIHLWDLSMKKHAWLLPSEGGVQALGGLEKLRADFLPADYARDAARQQVQATVHIEALWDPADPVGETRWLDGLEKPAGMAARCIAAAPFGTPEAAGIIEAQAAHPRVAGIRAILSFHPTNPAKNFAPRDGIAAEPAFRADIARLAPLGLMLELMMYPYQLDGVVDLARAFPDLRIILNHCASPIDRDADGMARWRRSLKALAAEPNVMLKVSNIGAYDPAPTFESIRAVALDCIDAFGPARAMFGTDWPVARLHSDYDTLWDQFRRIAAPFTPTEQRALFHDTAKHTYRL